MPNEAIFAALAFGALFVLFVVLPGKLQRSDDGSTMAEETNNQGNN